MSKSLLLLVALAFVSAACRTNAPSTSNETFIDEVLSDVDFLRPGAFAFTEHDYDSGPLNDPDVLQEGSFKAVKTDVRGRLFLPSGKGPFPLVVFLHGNHPTCGVPTGVGNPRIDRTSEFTSMGACPAGSVEVPSYRGYDEGARLLASWGYVVASINANRGMTGGNGLDRFDYEPLYARGNLVLRHIEELAKWSKNGINPRLRAEGLDLNGKLDITKVGLMGHSRGGEGIRHALSNYSAGSASAKWQARIPGLKFRAIFEIGPVDMGTDAGTNKVDASGVAWTVLIPGCDHDVAKSEGNNPFERMEVAKDDGFPKSVFTLWGANHNFFNAEWQVSDAANVQNPCVGNQKALWDAQSQQLLPPEFDRLDYNARGGLMGSEIQMKFEKALLLAFFHSYLGSGKELKWDHIFDPRYRLPRALSALAPSNREYLLRSGSKSVFDMTLANALKAPTDGLKLKTLKAHVNDQLALMTTGLKELTSSASLPESPAGGFKAVLAAGAFIRSAAVLEGRARPGGYKIVLPFDQIESTEDYWALDMALAIRRPCYKFMAFDRGFQTQCDRVILDDNFEIALVLADGTVSRPVKVKDYVMLENWYDDYFQVQGRGNDREFLFKYQPLVYQTARMELTDFSVRNQRVKGIQFDFKSGDEVSLIIESVRLTKRPSAYSAK